jgi:serine/threonine protein kinase
MTCPSCAAENDPGAEACFTCGRPLLALIRRGTMVAGRYEVVRPIGKGGMGSVYLARDCVFSETVAVKVLRADLSQRPEMIRRFRTELALAQKVKHPNVCRIHSSGEDDGRLYIVMDFVDGVDLKTLLREKGPLPAARAFEVAIQLAEGLQAVHNAGIVHRDVKSLNVMMDARGTPRLMDFDVAKQWDAEAGGDATQVGHVLGTPEYMSPEYARGGKVDVRSDVYSLGIVVFELFTGDVPFRGETPVATIMKQIREPAPLQGPKAALLPASMIPVLRKALAKSPDRRHASARSMAAALRLGQGTSAGPPLPPPPERADPERALLSALNPADATVRLEIPKFPEKDSTAVRSIPLLLQALEGPEPPPVPVGEVTLPPGVLSASDVRSGPTADRPVPGEVQSVAVLVEALLKAPEGDDRALAARTLGGIGPGAREAIPVLLEALRDRDSTVRVDAAAALEKMGPEAADALAAAVDDDDEVVRRIAADALARILRRKRRTGGA